MLRPSAVRDADSHGPFHLVRPRLKNSRDYERPPRRGTGGGGAVR